MIIERGDYTLKQEKKKSYASENARTIQVRIGIYFTNAISSATYDHGYLTHDMNHLSITTAMKITEERRTYSGRYIKRKLRGGGGACTVGVRFITLKSFT